MDAMVSMARTALRAAPQELDKLAICMECKNYAGGGCVLVTNEDGGICPGKLAQLMQQGLPCPDPAGDRWAIL
jgi:hypothetical protein